LLLVLYGCRTNEEVQQYVYKRYVVPLENQGYQNVRLSTHNMWCGSDPGIFTPDAKWRFYATFQGFPVTGTICSGEGLDDFIVMVEKP
jgi:hypothetical protein